MVLLPVLEVYAEDEVAFELEAAFPAVPWPEMVLGLALLAEAGVESLEQHKVMEASEAIAENVAEYIDELIGLTEGCL